MAIDDKIARITAANRIVVDENSDFEINNQAQLTAYIAVLTNRRDNIVANVKPIVAAWTP